MLSVWRNQIEELSCTECRFAPKIYILPSISIFVILCCKKTFKKELESCPIWMHQNILLWLCFTQTVGITLAAVVKYSENAYKYKKGLKSHHSWTDNRDMIMDCIHFISKFCQFSDNCPNVIIPVELQFMISQQVIPGDLIFLCCYHLGAISRVFGPRGSVSNTDHGGSRIFQRCDWLILSEQVGPIWRYFARKKNI